MKPDIFKHHQHGGKLGSWGLTQHWKTSRNAEVEKHPHCSPFCPSRGAHASQGWRKIAAPDPAQRKVKHLQEPPALSILAEGLLLGEKCPFSTKMGCLSWGCALRAGWHWAELHNAKALRSPSRALPLCLSCWPGNSLQNSLLAPPAWAEFGRWKGIIFSDNSKVAARVGTRFAGEADVPVAHKAGHICICQAL